MPQTTNGEKYKYDIAISLCKQDIDFARTLVKAINPSLKVFFYDDRQEELINNSGPVAFANTFGEESRIVVILSRKEWGNTYYTEIERNAIISRTKGGYQFLMVIPIAEGEIPAWYPSTHIYANPFRFTIDQLAHFIEFKVTEEGGIVKPLTVEGVYQNFLDKIEQKKSIVNLQHQQVAVEIAKAEVNKFSICFNEKIDFLSKAIVYKVDFIHFYPTRLNSYFSYGDYLLECKFLLQYYFYSSIITTQDAIVEFELYKSTNGVVDRTPIETEQRIFCYSPVLQGWGRPLFYEQVTDNEKQVLFRNRDNIQFYDLIDIMSTSSLVDSWFQRLLSSATENIERFL